MARLGIGSGGRTKDKQRARAHTVPVPAGVAGRQAERCDVGGVGDRMTMGNKR